MNRKLKALGLALIAALSLSVVASAQAAEFHTGATHTILEGEQTTTHEFIAGSGFGAITCTTAKFAGTSSTLTTTTSEQDIEATYSGCKDSLGRTAHVSMNSCYYKFTTTAIATEGKVHLKCKTAGDSVTITVTGSPHCTVHLPAQDNLGTVQYHNAAGHITVTVHITGITSLVTGGFFACGVSSEHQTSGTYKGTTTIKGKTTAGAGTTISVS